MTSLNSFLAGAFAFLCAVHYVKGEISASRKDSTGMIWHGYVMVLAAIVVAYNWK